MRISDWSSDVCSSDLAGCGWPPLCRPNSKTSAAASRRVWGPTESARASVPPTRDGSRVFERADEPAQRVFVGQVYPQPDAVGVGADAVDEGCATQPIQQRGHALRAHRRDVADPATLRVHGDGGRVAPVAGLTAQDIEPVTGGSALGVVHAVLDRKSTRLNSS